MLFGNMGPNPEILKRKPQLETWGHNPSGVFMSGETGQGSPFLGAYLGQNQFYPPQGNAQDTGITRTPERTG